MSVLDKDNIFNITLSTTLDNVSSNVTSLTRADNFRIVVFMIVLVTGFTLNCIKISLVFQTSKQLNRPFNILVVNLAIVNLITCLGNIPSSVLNTNNSRHLWYHGAIHIVDCITLCLAGTVTILGLILIAINRLIQVRHSIGFSRRCSCLPTPVVCARIVVIYSWIHGIILSMLFSVPGLSARECRVQLCRSWAAYVWTVAVFGFLLPAVTLCCLYGYIVYAEVQQRKMLCQAYTADNSSASGSVCESDDGSFRYVASLTIAWFLFQPPLLITRFIDLISPDLRPHLNDSVCSFELRAVLRWLFVLYTMVLPVQTVFTKREFWLKFKKLVLCHKTNIVVDLSPLRSTPTDQQIPIVAPVLFPTPQGLRLQKYDAKASKTQSAVTQMECATKDDGAAVQATTQRCDVFGSFYSGDILSEEGSTSDYDSAYDCNIFALPNGDRSGEDVKNVSKENSSLGCAERMVQANGESKVASYVVSLADERLKTCCPDHHDLEKTVSAGIRRRFSSESVTVVLKTAVKCRKKKSNENEVPQNKCSEEVLQYSKEDSVNCEHLQNTEDDDCKERLTKKRQGQRRQKKQTKSNVNISNDIQVIQREESASPVVSSTRGEDAVPTKRRRKAAKDTSFKDEANNNNSLEVNIRKISRHRLESDSKDKLLESSNTSSELTVLREASSFT